MLSCFNSKQDLKLLLEEIKKLDFWVDGSGAHMAYPPNKEGMILPSKIQEAVNEIGGLRNQTPLYVMINIVPPNVIVPKHIDTTIKRVIRWHLPVTTNDRAFWWSEIDGTEFLKEGFWYGPMRYDVLHQVGNLGTTERIHLVVDLE